MRKNLNVNHDLKNDNIEDLKKYMEGLKEGLTNLLQERLPNGKKVVEKSHDENKINVNHDLIESSSALKSHYILNIDMRNFDGMDLVIWILQME